MKFNDMIKSKRYGLKKTPSLIIDYYDDEGYRPGMKEMLYEKLYMASEERTLQVMEVLRLLDDAYIFYKGVDVTALSRMIDDGRPLVMGNMILGPDGGYYSNDCVLDREYNEYDLVHDSSISVLRDACESGGYQPAEPDVGINSGYNEYYLNEESLDVFDCDGVHEGFYELLEWWATGGERPFRTANEIDWDSVDEEVFNVLNEDDYDTWEDYEPDYD